MKKIKKFIIRAAAIAAAASLLSVAAFAYGWTGSVQVNTYLNVRKYANTGAPVIGRLYNGQKVTVTGSSNGWYQISYNGSAAWVSGIYISDSRAQTVVQAAKNELGVRYVFGGASPSTGFDCSGLVLYAYSQAGITLPHSAAQQSTKGTWVSRSDLKPGDIVFFDTDGGHNNITHDGIYIGGGNFIQAESGSVMKVTETSLSNSYWSGAYMSARRLLN